MHALELLSAACCNAASEHSCHAHLGVKLNAGLSAHHPLQVTLACLAGRRFPTEPPRGKGELLAGSSGLVGRALLSLPDVEQLAQALG